MGVWFDILNLAATGGSDRARYSLVNDLPLVLAQWDYTRNQWVGPIPMAIHRFLLRLDPDERHLLASHEDEFRDQLLDDVTEQILFTLDLVELCHQSRTISLQELALVCNWPTGLKRENSWKQQRIRDLLAAMHLHQIPLPIVITQQLGPIEETPWRFDEVAYSAAPERLRLTWKDFRRHLFIESGALHLIDEDAGEGIGGESIDYSVVSIGAVSLATIPATDLDLRLDCIQSGRQARAQVNNLLIQLDTESPFAGYCPIAWHLVFWLLNDDYEVLNLELETHEPFRETNDHLRQLLQDRFPNVTGLSLSSVRRRREKLEGVCRFTILSEIQKIFQNR